MNVPYAMRALVSIYSSRGDVISVFGRRNGTGGILPRNERNRLELFDRKQLADFILTYGGIKGSIWLAAWARAPWDEDCMDKMCVGGINSIMGVCGFEPKLQLVDAKYKRIKKGFDELIAQGELQLENGKWVAYIPKMLEPQIEVETHLPLYKQILGYGDESRKSSSCGPLDGHYLAAAEEEGKVVFILPAREKDGCKWVARFENSNYPGFDADALGYLPKVQNEYDKWKRDSVGQYL